MNPYAVQSPQAPGDLMPVPWQERPLSDIGAPSNVVETAAKQGIWTLEDLAKLEDWSTLAGVGEKTAEKMRCIFDAYRGTE